MISIWIERYKDYIDRIDPDVSMDTNAMDSTADTDTGYFNETYNNFTDFDDISNDAESCSSSLIKYPF